MLRWEDCELIASIRCHLQIGPRRRLRENAQTCAVQFLSCRTYGYDATLTFLDFQRGL
jgi:hypothetical protein